MLFIPGHASSNLSIGGMSPWIHGFVPVDQFKQIGSRAQRFLLTGRLTGQSQQQLLPWQSFPAWLLYTCFSLCALAIATLVHYSYAQQYDGGALSSSWVRSLACVICVATLTPVLSAVPCAVLFVAFVYLHARACSPPDAEERQPGGGDCTRFVKFRDPAVHESFRGKRIDMETLYEMYFDCKLDFVSPPDRDACDASDMPLCLMKDVLARRDEFVRYTFGLTTHLPFLLLKWVPDVLSHSKSQDIGQVRDHYDRSKYYRQQHQNRADQATPFTADKAEDDFFGMFLGEAMVYTSGISPSLVAAAHKNHQQDQQQHQQQGQLSHALFSGVGEESVESMQECKLKQLCRKMRLQKGDFHLDIGCGWGTLVNHSVSSCGTIATGVTLSRNQV